MTRTKRPALWGVEWYSKNAIDGVSRHLLWRSPGIPLAFRTRREARAHVAEHYGYIRHRRARIVRILITVRKAA